ncbi:MAG: type II secretion system F family protein [Aquabacterium sp.]
MWIWVVLSCMLIGLASVLFLISNQDPTAPETEKRFNEALETPQDEGWLNQRKWRKANSLTQRFKRTLERIPGTDMDEVETLVRQAALAEDQYRTLVYASLWVTPAAATTLALMWAAANHQPVVLAALFGFVGGFIAPRSILRWLAKRRQKAIREEMPIVLNLMRLLFDAGLSLEHTLKAISDQGRQITPHLADEFIWVLTRIHHGQERGEALEEMARRLDVLELTETVAILKQSARYGGSLRESLLRYLRLMEDKRLTDLRDKIGKLSGQMTVVMVLCLFPALLVFMAGPATLQLLRALQSF